MLKSPADYVYLPQKSAIFAEYDLKGDIIPVADIEKRVPPIRVEDVCYLYEASAIWFHGWKNVTPPNFGGYHNNSGLCNRTTIGSLITNIYNRTRNSQPTAGFLLKDIDSFSEIPTFSIVSTYAPSLSRDLLEDAGLLLGNLIDDTSTPSQKPMKADWLRRVYWALFYPCHHTIKYEGYETYYDASYYFKASALLDDYECVYRDGPSSGGITTYTGMASITSSYISVQTPHGSKATYQDYAIVLRSIRDYSRSRSDGYYYMSLEGVQEDVFVLIDLKREDVASAYAVVTYGASNHNSYAYRYQLVLVRMEHYEGTIWKVKITDVQKCKSLMELCGADFSKVGTYTTSSVSIDTATSIYDIFVKYNQPYYLEDGMNWNWTP